MTDSIVYTQCPFCPRVIRKDKMVVHLCTHSKDIIAYMPVQQRQIYLEVRKPFITLMYKEEYLFLCCIHCKKGYLGQTKHRVTFKKVNHTECIKAFSEYECMYESVLPNKPIRLSDWKLIKKERVKSTAATAVVETVEPVVSPSPKPEACPTPVLSTDMETKIIAAWKAERLPDDNDVDSDEETIEGKLDSILNLLKKLKKNESNFNNLTNNKIHRQTSALKQRIDQLEKDLGKMEDKEQRERNAKEIAEAERDKLANR